jgi:peptide/nickel transport system substrate-binding protein
MKSLRLALGLFWGYIKTNRKSFLIGILASFLVIFYLPTIWPYLWYKSPQTIGLVGNYTLSTVPGEIQDQLSLGLVKLQNDGLATAAAATHWTTADSGKTFVFSLKPDLFWSDKEKFTSDQINYNLKGVIITKPNLETIRFSLSEPFAPLLPMLSQPLFKNGLVGLKNTLVTDIKFNGRFLSVIRLTNQQTKEAIVYKFYSSQEELLTALKLGAVSSAKNLHETALKNLPKNFKAQGEIDGRTQVMVFFNTQKNLLDEKTFRQGLIYALPNDFGQGENADSPMPKNSWVGNLLVKKYEQNLDLAKSNLVKSASGSAIPKIVLTTNRELEEVAKLIKGAWEKAGIETLVEVADTRPMNYDAYLAYVALPADPDQYVLWHSTQTGNISGYKSFKIDKLLEEGRQEIDQSKRKNIYQNFQKAITEDVPAAFLFYPKVYTIER